MHLEVRSLSCRRGSSLLFRDLSFTLRAGMLLHLQGENGSGKTSLLKIIAGFSGIGSGSIRWQGENILAWPIRYRAAFLYLGHQNGLAREFSPYENMHYEATLRQRSVPLREDDITSALDRVSLARERHTATSKLSAGQQRRAAIARLLLFPCALWLLDEPCSFLDKTHCQIMYQLLETHLQQNGIAIVASHDPLPIKNAVTQTVHLGRSAAHDPHIRQ